MKIKVIDPNGLRLAGKKTIPEGEVIEQPKGPQLDAWLRFEQVEIVKGKAGKSSEEDPAETGSTKKNLSAAEKKAAAKEAEKAGQS
ncbi:MAG: hypothetical protein K0R17_2244 [Rariglobus sp.]|jgi:hypothetical protein|nr:hypothetical protein [Rariglobus sp.]